MMSFIGKTNTNYETYVVMQLMRDINLYSMYKSFNM